MIELFAAPTSNGMRAKIVLDECGLPYRLTRIDLANRENATPGFLKLNPMGLIPVIVDHDPSSGPPIRIAQSVAIMVYVAEKAGLFLPGDDGTARASFNDALMNIATDVSMTFSAILAIVRSEQPDPATRSIFDDRFRQYLSVWDATLSAQPYCAGEAITVADFALFPVILRCKQLTPQLRNGFSHIEAWAERVGNRPGVTKGVDFG